MAAREKAEVYSVRIPAERLEQFREVAAKRGKALMRDWVIERLDRELKPRKKRGGSARRDQRATRSRARRLL